MVATALSLLGLLESFDESTGLPGTKTLKVIDSRAGSINSSGRLLGMIVIGGTLPFTAWFLDPCIISVGGEIFWSMGPILGRYHLKVDASAIYF